METIKVTATGNRLEYEVSAQNATAKIRVMNNEVTMEIQAFLKGEKGEKGEPGNAPQRLIYIANVNRSGNFLGSITHSVLLNTTGKTFTWTSSSGIDAVLSCNDNIFFDKIISITWYRIDGATYNNNPFKIAKSGNSLFFGLESEASQYRCAIEFYN